MWFKIKTKNWKLFFCWCPKIAKIGYLSISVPEYTLDLDHRYFEYRYLYLYLFHWGLYSHTSTGSQQNGPRCVLICILEIPGYSIDEMTLQTWQEEHIKDHSSLVTCDSTYHTEIWKPHSSFYLYSKLWQIFTKHELGNCRMLEKLALSFQNLNCQIFGVTNAWKISQKTIL